MILHVLGAGGGQPQRDRLLRGRLGDDLVTLTTAEIAETHKIEEAVVLEESLWPEFFDENFWNCAVVEKWPWGACRKNPPPPLADYQAQFLHSIEQTTTPTVLVTRDPAHPLVDNCARIYDVTVAGTSGPWSELDPRFLRLCSVEESLCGYPS